MEDAQVHVTKCRCEHDSDHAVSFHYWPDQAFGDEFTISTSLNHYRGFWSRVWIGIKYALGIDNTHYFFTEQTLDEDEVKKLQAYINNVANKFKDSGYPRDDGPLTDNQIAAIRAASSATNLPDSAFTKGLFKQ